MTDRRAALLLPALLVVLPAAGAEAPFALDGGSSDCAAGVVAPQTTVSLGRYDLCHSEFHATLVPGTCAGDACSFTVAGAVATTFQGAFVQTRAVFRVEPDGFPSQVLCAAREDAFVVDPVARCSGTQEFLVRVSTTSCAFVDVAAGGTGYPAFVADGAARAWLSSGGGNWVGVCRTADGMYFLR